jgi:hypothetical protein
LTWLPDVDGWAAQVSALTKPGGRFYIHDGHPLAWALTADELVVDHTYFEEQDPNVDDSGETYTDADGRLPHPVSHEWNHSLGEIVTALIRHGLRIELLTEHDWTVFPRFPWLEQVDDGERRWVLPPDKPRVPLTFSLLATRPER